MSNLLFENKARAYLSGEPGELPSRVGSWPYQQTLDLANPTQPTWPNFS